MRVLTPLAIWDARTYTSETPIETLLQTVGNSYEGKGMDSMRIL